MKVNKYRISHIKMKREFEPVTFTLKIRFFFVFKKITFIILF